MYSKPTSSPVSGPKGPLTAWERWEMTSFNQREADVAPPVVATEPVIAPLEPVLLIDAAALARLRLEAQQAGEVEGRQQGFTQGHSEGYAAGLALAQEQAQSLRTLLLALPAALRSAEREVADDLLTLALDIARQMVRQALPIEPQPILTLVRELLHTE
ncbi:MAG: flagellar assembly protein FliH, partial [Polaromonas sp.]|nr:flagellar assembly protein FliH [Polaromonas sp.]